MNVKYNVLIKSKLIFNHRVGSKKNHREGGFQLAVWL
jgi:hypothetical protein